MNAFGNWFVLAEGEYSKPPFKGMVHTGKNGKYHCFESQSGYSQELAHVLAGKVSEQHGITAVSLEEK